MTQWDPARAKALIRDVAEDGECSECDADMWITLLKDLLEAECAEVEKERAFANECLVARHDAEKILSLALKYGDEECKANREWLDRLFKDVLRLEEENAALYRRLYGDE